MVYRNPSLLTFATQNDQATSDDETLKPNTNTTPKPIYTAPTPATPDAFNMFDPADLPPRLSEYANMVYSACEDLGNFFGFQDASVRNQAEHLLILLSNNRRYMNSHILPPALQPPSPIHALHAKVFSNYMKWCRYQGVPPIFQKCPPPPRRAWRLLPVWHQGSLIWYSSFVFGGKRAIFGGDGGIVLVDSGG